MVSQQSTGWSKWLYRWVFVCVVFKSLNDFIGEYFLGGLHISSISFLIWSHLVPTDILGSEDLHPKHLLYHVPQYLRGVHKNEKHFQVNLNKNGSNWWTFCIAPGEIQTPFCLLQIQLRRQKALEHTKFPDAYPSKWQGWRLTVSELAFLSERISCLV